MSWHNDGGPEDLLWTHIKKESLEELLRSERFHRERAEYAEAENKRLRRAIRALVDNQRTGRIVHGDAA